jgi:hypothetical protein
MTTWNITFQKIQDIHPQSIKLLQLMSFLDPDEIPGDLLSTSPGLDDVTSFNEAMRHLLRFSLVGRIRSDLECFRLHRLVSLYTREYMAGTDPSHGQDPSNVETTLNIALCAIAEKFPDGKDYNNWEKCSRIMPHVTAITKHRQRAPVDRLLEQLPGLLHNCGGYQLRLG